jgi:hypothetical protein
MEIIYIICGFFTLATIWSFNSDFLQKNKENKEKLNEYPILLKELSNEKLASKRHIESYQNENFKTKKITNQLIVEKQKIENLEKDLIFKVQESEKTIKNLEKELHTKIQENNKSIEYLTNYEKERNQYITENEELNFQIQESEKNINHLEKELHTKIQENEKSTQHLKDSQNEVNLSIIRNQKIDIKLKEQIQINFNLESDLNNSKRKYIEENQKSNSLLREKDKLKNTVIEQHKLYLSIEGKSQNSVTKLTSMYSDFLLLEYNLVARYLESKKRPALSESKRIKELKVQSKFHLQQYRQMLYKYEYILNIFPELTNYVDDFDTLKQLDNINSIEDFKEEFDNVQNYLSKEEYLDLDENYRNQLALDRYLKGKKTSWQVGRDYEMSCGITYEERGWNVEYFGMEKRLNDLGRDLIVKKGNEVEIIQCKLWKKTKTIHEKHILQLYGTTVIDTLINPDLFKVVTPVFITNTSLSETATKFAKILGVRIEKWEMKEFPRIKCNLGIDDNGIESKIYHLPFDQHYDRTKIKKGQGFLAKNIQEATEKGFRRSYKYYGR